MPKEIIRKLQGVLENEHYSWQQIHRINQYIRLLRDIDIPDMYLHSLGTQEAEFGAWDEALTQYCNEVINDKLPHTHTFFSRCYENLRVIGKIQKNTMNINRLTNYHDIIGKEFNLLSCKNIEEYIIQRNQRLLIDTDGYIFAYLKSRPSYSSLLKIHKKHSQNLIRKFISRNVFGRSNKVIRIASSIQKNGWQPENMKNHHTIMVARSLNTGKFSVLTGRHRLAAIRYLVNQGCVKVPSVKCLMFEHTGTNFMWNSNLK